MLSKEGYSLNQIRKMIVQEIDQSAQRLQKRLNKAWRKKPSRSKVSYV